MDEKKTSRFSDMKALDTVVTDAAMTTNKAPSSPATKEKAKKKNIIIYNLDEKLYDVIDATGESFSSYAKRAILKMAKEDGLL